MKKIDVGNLVQSADNSLDNAREGEDINDYIYHSSHAIVMSIAAVIASLDILNENLIELSEKIDAAGMKGGS